MARPAAGHRSVDALAVLLAVLLLSALGSLTGPGLARHVQDRLAESGTSWPVTAVLLNFRGYDTLLETAVMLLALLGSVSLHRARELAPRPALSAPGPILTALARQLVPLMVLVAGYLLWAGSHGPGGAFQGGAILAAAGVLLVLAEQRGWRRFRGLGKPALVSGFIVFLVLAAVSPLRGGPLLRYPPGAAASLLMVLESVLAISIGATLLGMFVSNPQDSGPRQGGP
jgi:multisubunit Na+/H+ antiporter MnhB subunit